MNTTGTVSHFNKKTETSPMTMSRMCGKLFLMEKFLNLNASIGTLLTINQLSEMMSAYKTHLFTSQSLISMRPLPKCKINGNDAMNKPTAGVGIPLKPYCCESSKLNFAKRYAAAQLRINAGSNHAIETSNPFSSRAKLMRNS